MFCNEKWIPALTEGNPFRGAGMTLDQRFPSAGAEFGAKTSGNARQMAIRKGLCCEIPAPVVAFTNPIPVMTARSNFQLALMRIPWLVEF